MTAASIMDPHPTTLRRDDKISYAAHCIMSRRYRNIPVVDEQGCYVGIVGVHCLLRMVLPKAAVMHQGLDSLTFVHDDLQDLHRRLQEVGELPVSACMSDQLETIPPDHPLLDTLLLLYRNKASIPVVQPDSCKLLGMVSYWDAGRHILQGY